MTKDRNENQIDQVITDFVHAYITAGRIHAQDSIYVTNRLIDLLSKQSIKKRPQSTNPLLPLELFDKIIEYAVDTEIIEDLPSAKDVFGAKVMDLITPSPSEINRQFWNAYDESPKKATDTFFNTSQQTNYIKTREIANNIEYTHDTVYGQLDITINLSKPEKDPKEITLAGKNQSHYPDCVLCMENEGYEGHLTHPGRSNHRIIRLDVSGEEWGFQYSPYAYYNEHAIFLSKVHRKMDVGIQAIKNLLDIISTLPHYFVGSNAGLPIVGGSILSHDHYQGGRHTFPLERAEEESTFELNDTPEVKASIIKWPMSVIRLNSSNKEELVKAADKVMRTWEGYSDESVDIYSETEGVPHNAVTPIARRNGDDFELDLVLRNNRTSQQYPDGIFHPHPPVQHIKKENIGLIEVMGLAILPPRLKGELQTVRDYLIGEVDSVDSIHQEWADKLKETTRISSDNVKEVMDQAVGEVFLQVLKDAGVFKRNEQGRKAFRQFVDYLGNQTDSQS